MRKFIYILFFIVIFVFTPAFVQIAIAQPPPVDIVIPIDGGLGFLLAAGVGYAAKKLHGSRKNNNNPPI